MAEIFHTYRNAILFQTDRPQDKNVFVQKQKQKNRKKNKRK